MRKLVILILLLAVNLTAGQVYIDTLGGIKNLSGTLTYRETRIEVPVADKISIGVVNSVDDGLLLTGSLDNWRVGAYAVYELSCCSSMPFSVFAGGSLSGSSIIATSIGFDAGFRMKISDFPLVPVAVLVEGTLFSDSANVLGFVGPSLSLGGLIKNLSLDLGYSPSAFIPLTTGTLRYYHGISVRISIII